MTSRSVRADLKPKEVAQYGSAQARYLAFDAVNRLWRKRQSEGMQQVDLANAIGKDKAWVSRYLRGPGNWTLQTLGKFVEALQGELDILVRGKEELPKNTRNSDAYSGYEVDTKSQTSVKILGAKESNTETTRQSVVMTLGQQ